MTRPLLAYLYYLFGARSGNRTHTTQGHSILSAARLPITTSAHVPLFYFVHDGLAEGYDNSDKVFLN